MKKLFLILLTIASTNVIVAMQPHQETAHERFLRLTVQHTVQETQTPVMLRGTAPRVQFLTQPITNDELGQMRRNITAPRLTRVAPFTWHNQQPAANSMHVQSNEPSSQNSSLFSDSFSSDGSFISLSSHASERTENRDNNALSDYVFRAVNDFRPAPNAQENDEAQVARFLVQIRGIPARLTDAQNQTSR
jgi:hypothetical protein